VKNKAILVCKNRHKSRLRKSWVSCVFLLFLSSFIIEAFFALAFEVGFVSAQTPPPRPIEFNRPVESVQPVEAKKPAEASPAQTSPQAQPAATFAPNQRPPAPSLLSSDAAPLPAANSFQSAPILSRPVQTGTLNVSAFFTGENKTIRSGLAWRIFGDAEETSGEGRSDERVIKAHSEDATASFTLPAGSYTIHLSYGFASNIRHVTVRAGATITERIGLAAGGLKPNSAINNVPIPPIKLSYAVYVPIGGNSEGRQVVTGVRAGELLRLPEGTYHIVSNYGDTNSIMRTDLKVESGKVTEATLNHRAATVTLKLVTAPSAEALAGTAFSVLTPGGDVIREAIGAFPQMVLAEGSYVLLARLDGQVYTKDFKVESGLDRDIEILAK
jgi:hypothetical protein